MRKQLWRKILGWNIGDRCLVHLPFTSLTLKGVVLDTGVHVTISYTFLYRMQEVPAAIVRVYHNENGHCIGTSTEIVPLKCLEEIENG